MRDNFSLLLYTIQLQKNSNYVLIKYINTSLMSINTLMIYFKRMNKRSEICLRTRTVLAYSAVTGFSLSLLSRVYAIAIICFGNQIIHSILRLHR